MSNEVAAVVAAPRESMELLVRTRRPGDRVRFHGREMSLRRFLMSRRVPADLRDELPLVAAGRRVLFVPGQILDGAAAGERLVRLELARS